MTLSAIAVVLLAAMLLVPVSRRVVAAGVFLLAAVAPGFAAAEAVAVTIAGRLSWLGDAWDEDWSSSARDVVGVGVDWPGHVSTPLLLLSVAVALLVAGRAVPFLRAADALVVPVLALAVLTVPAAFDLPFWAGLSIDVALALLLLVGIPLFPVPVIMQFRVRLGGSRVRCRRARPGRCLVVRRGRDDVGRAAGGRRRARSRCLGTTVA